MTKFNKILRDLRFVGLLLDYHVLDRSSLLATLGKVLEPFSPFGIHT